MNGPVFFRFESADLLLPIADQPERHGLHAPCGQAPPHFLPQQRRELVSHQPVQHPTRLLSIYFVLVDRAGVLEGFQNRLLGNLVEHDPVDLGLGSLQLLREMKTDRLAFTIRVGRQVDVFDFLRRLLELGEYLLALWNDDVVGTETLLDIDSQLALGEIPNVSHGGFHQVVSAQELVDGFRLRRRLNDN